MVNANVIEEKEREGLQEIDARVADSSFASFALDFQRASRVAHKTFDITTRHNLREGNLEKKFTLFNTEDQYTNSNLRASSFV